jgi:hypothetical protein
MMRNTLCRACGCEICDCVKPLIKCSECSADCTNGIEDTDYFELEEEDSGEPFTYCSKCFVVLKEQIETETDDEENNQH